MVTGASVALWGAKLQISPNFEFWKATILSRSEPNLTRERELMMNPSMPNFSLIGKNWPLWGENNKYDQFLNFGGLQYPHPFINQGHIWQVRVYSWFTVS